MDTPLPELHQGDLSPAQVDQLLGELAHYATIHGISAKGGPQACTSGENLSLAQAGDLLRMRSVRGVQIRYTYDGCDWMDTLLLVEPPAVRVVRIAVPPG